MNDSGLSKLDFVIKVTYGSKSGNNTYEEIVKKSLELSKIQSSPISKESAGKLPAYSIKVLQLFLPIICL